MAIIEEGWDSVQEGMPLPGTATWVLVTAWHFPDAVRVTHRNPSYSARILLGRVRDLAREGYSSPSLTSSLVLEEGRSQYMVSLLII